jgi:hypothetical protein
MTTEAKPRYSFSLTPSQEGESAYLLEGSCGYYSRLNTKVKFLAEHDLPVFNPDKIGVQDYNKESSLTDSPPYLPSSVSRKEKQEILMAYRSFTSSEPYFDNKPKWAYAQKLRAVKDFYCSLNTYLDLESLMTFICESSILDPTFNERYSKVYKYSRPAYWAKSWLIPDDAPPPEFSKWFGNSWITFASFLKKFSFMTPELLIPPECLFPWKDNLPEDIEILEEYTTQEPKWSDECRQVLKRLLRKPTKEATMVDFLLAQTNTKKCVRFGMNLKQAWSKLEKGQPLTDFKYNSVSKYFEDQARMSGPDWEYAVRTPVWKRPSEFRDAVSLTPPLLYKVWRLNTLLKYMIAPHHGYNDARDRSDLKTFFKPHHYFFQYDWKKSGLTMPHWFVKQVVEEIENLTGDSLNWPTDGWPILDPHNKKIIRPSNYGYSLGMINNVYTLWNIALFELGIEKGLLHEKSEICSFNDDVLIRSEENGYHKFLRFLQESGGYVEPHKSFCSTTQINFCEQIFATNTNCSFKWISNFNTLIQSMLECENKDHLRFLITDCWDAISGYSKDTPRGAKVSPQLLEVLQETVAHFLQYNFGDFDYEHPPELGGIGLGKKFRSEVFNMKYALIMLERMEEGFMIKANLLKMWKELLTDPPKFRPWYPFPEGKTKELFKRLSEVSGIEGELKPFWDRANNKFNTDTRWYRSQFWSAYKIKAEQIRAQPQIIDFWGWASTQEWPSYAIPKALVAESEICHGNKQLPFVKISRRENKYSLPSMMVSYIFHKKQPELAFCGLKDIDFSQFYDFEVPIMESLNGYYPRVDMETMSKLSNFADPRRAVLDYYFRYDEVLIKLKTVDLKAQRALKLMEAAYPNEDFTAYAGASWWTPIPVPYFQWWLDNLIKIPQHLHAGILLEFHQGYFDKCLTKQMSITYEMLEQHMADHKDFWTSMKKMKKKHLLRKFDYELTRKEISEKEAVNIVPENIMYSVDMNNLASIFTDFLDSMEPKKEEEPNICEIRDYRVDFAAELAEISAAIKESPEEPDYVPEEKTQEELEMEFLLSLQGEFQWDSACSDDG